MESGKGRGLRQLACLALLLPLAGCPQLMSDDFDFFAAVHTTDSLPDGHILPDASGDPDPSSLSDAGGDVRSSPVPDADVGEPESDAGLGAPSGLADAAAPSDAAAPLDGGTMDPNAQALHDALVHRYRFNAGATLADSIGGANATNVGLVTFSAGAAVFAGTNQYLDLPNDLLSGLTNVSIEAWVIWDVTDPLATTSQWQRIFDFGSNDSGVEGSQGSNANGVYLTTSGGSQGRVHFEYRNNGNFNLDSPDALPTGTLVQIVGVVDQAGSLLSLYENGALVGARAATLDLSTVVYRNNWLGRSQYTGNPPFKGRMFDFRIYSSALTSAQIQASYAAGADADW